MSYQSTWDAHRHDILAAANRIKAQHPDAWEEVKVPGQKSRRFISLVAAECQRLVSPDIGCNLKRGGPDVSLDVLAMPNASGARDATGTYPGLELRDIIGGAEGPNPSIVWGDATPATIAANVPGGWIKTAALPPLVQLPPVPQYPSEPDWWEKVFDVEAAKRYARATPPQPYPNPRSARWSNRTAYDIGAKGLTKEASMALHLKELDDELGLP